MGRDLVELQTSPTVSDPDKKKKKRSRDADTATVAEDSKRSHSKKAAETESDVLERTTPAGEGKKKKKQKRAQEEESADSDAPTSATEKSSKKHKTPSSKESKLYKEHPEVAALTTAEIEAFRTEHNITFKTDSGEDNCAAEFKPILQFHQTGFCSEILQACSTFTKPTPIQSQCWPIIMSQRDTIGIAETGSGKTFAFGLPILQQIQQSGKPKAQSEPLVLVLAPTRELAVQTSDNLQLPCKRLGMVCTCIYGGVSKQEQREVINKGVHIVVATPGRLLDLIEDGAFTLSKVSYMVLDEADRMLDMGFEDDVKRLFARTDAATRRTVMFSATWPKSVRKLASEFLVDPIRVCIGSTDLAASGQVTQVVEIIDDMRAKEDRLIQLLKQYHGSRKNRVLIFALYKKESARLEELLNRKGWSCTAIHGDKTQAARQSALDAFKDGSSPLLVATDVAARGLDIPNVEYVINYTFPLTIEDYVHRIGRTGRAGKTGTSHTLFSPSHDKQHAGSLCNVLRRANQNVPAELEKFGPTTVKKKEHKVYGAHFKDVDMSLKSTKVTFDD